LELAWNFVASFLLGSVLLVPNCYFMGSASVACFTEHVLMAFATALVIAAYLEWVRIQEAGEVIGAREKRAALWTLPTFFLFVFAVMSTSCILGGVDPAGFGIDIGGACGREFGCLTGVGIFTASYAVFVVFLWCAFLAEDPKRDGDAK